MESGHRRKLRCGPSVARGAIFVIGPGLQGRGEMKNRGTTALALAVGAVISIAATGETRAGECSNPTPLSCPGINKCCPRDKPNACVNLRARHPRNLAPIGWSGCVQPASLESEVFWSRGCAIWVRCR
jgi:hypothetical protein